MHQKKYISLQQLATAYYNAFFCTTKYYLVLQIFYRLDKTTPYYKVALGTTRYYQKLVHTTKYYSVLQSITPYYKIRQNTNPNYNVLQNI